MNAEDKIADSKKREEEENKINRQIISNAIADLLSNFNYTCGSIKKTKTEKYLKIFVETGAWSENEKAVKNFNETRVEGATIAWFRDIDNCDFNEYGCKEYKWEIPLYLVDEAILEAVKK